MSAILISKPLPMDNMFIEVSFKLEWGKVNIAKQLKRI